VVSYGVHVESYRVRVTSYDVHVTSYGVRASSYGVHVVSYGVHMDVYGVHDLSYGVHMAFYSFCAASYVVHVELEKGKFGNPTGSFRTRGRIRKETQVQSQVEAENRKALSHLDTIAKTIVFGCARV
jgi:hypothetical protein